MRSNWDLLAEKGVCMESSLHGTVVRVQHLDLETALHLGHALTLQLDSEERFPQYDDVEFSYERVVREAMERISHQRERVFGETRPARAKFAVRVDQSLEGDFLLVADVRNDYEIRPELGGSEKLQYGFTNTIEALDIL